MNETLRGAQPLVALSGVIAATTAGDKKRTVSEMVIVFAGHAVSVTVNVI